VRLNDFFPSPISFEPNILTPFVSVRPSIIIRFNIELLVDLINSDEKLNQQIILVEESSDSTIGVKFINYSQKILEFEPAQDLNPGSTYQVTVLKTIQSVEGREASANRSFVFTVSQTDVPQVELLEPANFTSTSSVGPFIWNPISVSTSGSTGTIFYRVELDDTIAFKSVASNGWSTLTTDSSAMPGVSLTPSKHYFWRVRGEFITSAGSSVGQWSDPFVWYYGTFLQPSPSTRQTYPDAVTFQVDATSGFENGLSNQLDFPSMVFILSGDIDPSTVTPDTVYMTRESVDGWPTSDKFRVTLNLSVTGRTLYIYPEDPIIVNSRYTLYITTGVGDYSGNYLQETVTRYFTSRYSPLYMGSNVLRANFGQFLIGIPDDILNFQIFRVSLDVNRHWILYYNPLIGGPTEEQVRAQTFLLSYAMERWVECETAVRLLTMKYYELLDTADSMKRLGDYQEQHGVNLLRSLEDEIKRQKQMALQWISEFSRHRARVRSTRKSERWPVWQKSTDYSWNSFRRDNI
jgi:hypothetical protein